MERSHEALKLTGAPRRAIPPRCSRLSVKVGRDRIEKDPDLRVQRAP